MANILLNRDPAPDETLLEGILGKKYPLLTELRRLIAGIVPDTREEWKYYGKKNGWVLKTFHKKRNLFFVIICDGFFKIAFVFGKKAVRVVMDSRIDRKWKEELASAVQYVEGSGLNIPVHDEDSLKDIPAFLAIKLEN